MTKPFDPTKPCKTRDGREARIICTDATLPGFPIVALVGTGAAEGMIHYTNDGRYRSSSTCESSYDLINTPKTIEGWVNIYCERICGQSFHRTKEDAGNAANAGRIACVHISFEEGEGL